MSPVPGFYDYARPAGWALPALHPASDAFHLQCAGWLDQLQVDEIACRAACAREVAARYFDYQVVAPKFAQFVGDLLGG